jgi:hypothetical protein
MLIIFTLYLVLVWLVFAKLKLLKWGWVSGAVTLVGGAFILAVFLAMFNYLTPSGSFVVTSRVMEVAVSDAPPLAERGTAWSAGTGPWSRTARKGRMIHWRRVLPIQPAQARSPCVERSGAVMMTRLLAIAFAAVLAYSAAAENAAAETRQLSCSGAKIEPAALSPMAVKLTFLSPLKMALNVGNSDINGRIINDNQIMLRFRTKDFAGELFHYTNDLFLIYHSGHLAKLTCTA